MPESAYASIEYYRRFAESMVRDIDLAKEDVEFIKRGGRILTAADFSEIYAYSMSASDSFLARHDAKFLEEVAQRAVLNELHDSIMLFYLFESDEPLWLLDPYLLELRNFMRIVSSDRFKGTVKAIGEALRQIRLATSNPEFSELAELAKKVQITGKALDKQDSNRVYRFIERVAPAIVHTAKDKSGKPIDRLRRLLQEGRLQLPSDIPAEIQKGDADTYGRWYNGLSKLRRDHDAQNALDAQAVSVVFALNKWLLKSLRPRRIVLLTRSEKMHQLMREEVAHDLWSEAGGNSLRHPRIVLALLDENAEIIRSIHADRQLQALTRWERTFGLVADVSHDLPDSLGSLTPQEQARRHIALIADVWQRYCSVKATKLAIEYKYLQENSELRAISILIDPESLKRSVRERLNQLDSLLSGMHFVFATLISPGYREARRMSQDTKDRTNGYDITNARDPIVQNDEGLVQITSAHATPMPFRIMLSDARLLNALRQEGKEPFIAFSVISRENMLDTSADPDVDIEVEWFLAMGYVCAAIGAWMATKQACEFINGVREFSGLETQLLYARAMRHISEDVAVLLPVAQGLRNSLEKMRLSKTNNARLIAERIKFEFIIARRALDVGDREIFDSQVKNIQGCWPDAFDLAMKGPPGPESCELINNLLYHSLQLWNLGKTIRELSESKQLYKCFEQQISSVYGSRWQGWPDSFLDTYAWSRLQLIRSKQLSMVDMEVEVERILVPLKTIASREYVSDVDISDFRLHAQEATTFFEGSNRGGIN
jgi:hypothetical protein